MFPDGISLMANKITAVWVDADQRFAFGIGGPGAVEVDQEQFAALMAAQSSGKVIGRGEDGMPCLSDPPAPLPPSKDEVEAARLRAYADPLTGSDRYFAEAQRESLLGNVEAADAAKALGMARFAEIQAEYPWPAE